MFELNFHFYLSHIICTITIIRTAKERRPGALGFAEAMMVAYNAKNKYRLSLRTLYGTKNVTYEEMEDETDSPGDIKEF